MLKLFCALALPISFGTCFLICIRMIVISVIIDLFDQAKQEAEHKVAKLIVHLCSSTV